MRNRILLLMWTVAAFAAARAAAETPGSFRRLSVTVDPLYLTSPVVQLTAEFRPVAHWSGAVLAGKGSYSNHGQPENTLWQIGAQARWYPFAPSWREAHLLLQYIREHQRDERNDAPTGAYVYDNYDTALLGGYKFIAAAGFTFEAQAGLLLSASREHGAGFSVTLEPHANLGVGWSF